MSDRTSSQSSDKSAQVRGQQPYGPSQLPRNVAGLSRNRGGGSLSLHAHIDALRKANQTGDHFSITSHASYEPLTGSDAALSSVPSRALGSEGAMSGTASKGTTPQLLLAREDFPSTRRPISRRWKFEFRQICRIWFNPFDRLENGISRFYGNCQSFNGRFQAPRLRNSTQGWRERQGVSVETQKISRKGRRHICVCVKRKVDTLASRKGLGRHLVAVM